MVGRYRRGTSRSIAVGLVVLGVTAAGVTGCGSSANSGTTPSGGGASTAPATYQPGTRSTAQSHPGNPVIVKMSYRTVDGATAVVVPVTTVAGSAKDTVTATVTVYPSMDSPQRPPAPIYTYSTAVATGDNKEAVLPLSPEALATVRNANPGIAEQLVVVSVEQKVDGDGDGRAEGSLNTRSSYHDAQVKKAGETVNLTIGTNVAGINLVTIPTVCMYNDSGSNFAPLNTTLAQAGDYVSSSIEADGDIGESPQYGGPAWSQIASELTGDTAVDVGRYILDALEPINIAIQGIIDVLSLAVQNCDSQASIFTVIAAAQSPAPAGATASPSPTASSSSGGGQSQTTSQSYVASEQTSNGLLSAATALSWQQNMEEQGGAVWQTSVSDQYLQQAVNGSVDSGLSIAATNQGVGVLTTSSSWTFMINQGGTSSIPNGCDDRGC